MIKNLLSTLICFTLIYTCSFAQGITGKWYGILKIQTTELPIVIEISQEGKVYSSTLQSPKQSKQQVPMSKTVLKGKKISISQPSMNMQYEGNHMKDSIVGTFQQATMSFPLVLYRTAPKPTIVQRPQTPQKPYNYKTTDLTFTNTIENFTLEGTLTEPKNSKPDAVIIFVSGSGQQDRDETILEHKPFLVLADYLTNNNIATFRYDDRGVGKSEGNYEIATTQNNAQDALAAIKLIKSQPQFKDVKIGIAGHSEGGMIAYMLAADYPELIDFIILIAAPVVPGKDLLIVQQKVIGLASGINPILVDNSYQMNQKIYNAIADTSNSAEVIDKIISEAYTQFYNSTPENERASLGDLNTTIMNTKKELNAPWLNYFIKFKPADYFSRLKVPTLAIYGHKDMQVNYQMNLDAIQDLQATTQQFELEIKEFENLNHLMQVAETGHPSEYETIEQTIDPSVMHTIIEYVNLINNKR